MNEEEEQALNVAGRVTSLPKIPALINYMGCSSYYCRVFEKEEEDGCCLKDKGLLYSSSLESIC